MQRRRVIVPLRIQVRGGRAWLSTPDGRDAVRRRQVDKCLVKALQAAHRLSGSAA